MGHFGIGVYKSKHVPFLCHGYFGLFFATPKLICVLDNNENPEAPLPRETIPLEQDLEQLETQLREVNANQEQLNKNFLELTEVIH